MLHCASSLSIPWSRRTQKHTAFGIVATKKKHIEQDENARKQTYLGEGWDKAKIYILTRFDFLPFCRLHV